MNEGGSKPVCKKVMVIDDNEIDLYIAELCIQHYCFAGEIVLLDSAKKGLDYLSSFEHTPDMLPELIFLDIRMPEMDGFGFLEEYEKLPEAIKMKSIIMMLSSSLNQEDHEKVEKSRYVDRFLVKPLNKEKLEGIQFNNGKVVNPERIEEGK